MTLNEFASKCHDTAIYPPDKALEYLALGLAGEAGEVANKVQKWIRDEQTDGLCASISKELGDVLWFAAELAGVVHRDGLEGVARDLLAKLSDRKARGALGGSGDNR